MRADLMYHDISSPNGVEVEEIPYDTVPGPVIMEESASNHAQDLDNIDDPINSSASPNELSVVIEPYSIGVEPYSIELGQHLPTSPKSPDALPNCGPLDAMTWIAPQGRELGECMICLEELQPGQLITYLPCAHNFHNDCVLRWLGTKIHQHQKGCCPNCNLAIVAPVLPHDEDASSAGTARREVVHPTYVSQPFDPEIVTGSHCCGKTLSRAEQRMCVIVSLFFVCCVTAGAVFLTLNQNAVF